MRLAEPILSDAMSPLFAVIAAAAVLSALIVRRMIRVAVMDVPGARSAHDQPTPRGGGVGMVAAVLLGTPALLAILPGGANNALSAAPLLIGVLLLAAISWLDDLWQFKPLWKLAGQCAAAGLGVAAALVHVRHGIASPATLAAFAAAGFCWLLLCTNAVNFMDGLNGLIGGVGALCGGFAALAGLLLSDPLLLATGSMLAAGFVGFLPFNFPRARIFMGDVGSQTCGLIVGTFALLILADTGRPAFGLAFPLILAGLVSDVLFTLARRILARERITQAQRGHLYQVAARSGVSRVAVALMEWGFAAWGILLSLTLLPGRPLLAVLMAVLPQLSWGATVWLRARRSGIERWS